MKSFIALFAILTGLVSLAAADIGIRDYDTPVGYAALGDTTGGAGGPTIRVSTLDDLKSAVSGSSPKTVIISQSLTGNDVVMVGPNTSLYGASGVTLEGVGIRVLEVGNVILGNLKISKVLASAGDAIAIQQSNNVFVHHVDVSSDRDHGKDYYDGLLDITHGCQNVTVAWSFLHDHEKTSLIGHSDTNGAQDTSITVTYHHNYFFNTGSRCPSIRFGHLHVFNCLYDNVGDGIDTRDGAQVLVENNVFNSVARPVFSDFSETKGFAVLRGNDFGGSSVSVQAGAFDSVPYQYTLDSPDTVRSQVPSNAGATLNIS